ncbi:MAG: hypothetical protein ABSE21_01825 [Bryobacteraceae bacterium]
MPYQLAMPVSFHAGLGFARVLGGRCGTDGGLLFFRHATAASSAIAPHFIASRRVIIFDASPNRVFGAKIATTFSASSVGLLRTPVLSDVRRTATCTFPLTLFEHQAYKGITMWSMATAHFDVREKRSMKYATKKAAKKPAKKAAKKVAKKK